MWKVGGLKIVTAASRRIILPGWHRNWWKSAFFYKTLRTRKFSTGKFFEGSTHGILTHSRFRICVLKGSATHFRPCYSCTKSKILHHLRLRHIGSGVGSTFNEELLLANFLKGWIHQLCGQRWIFVKRIFFWIMEKILEACFGQKTQWGKAGTPQKSVLFDWKRPKVFIHCVQEVVHNEKLEDNDILGRHFKVITLYGYKARKKG